MAAFKVGQRVRIVGCEPNSLCLRRGAVGKEAVITAIPSVWRDYSSRIDCDIRVDGEREDWIAGFAYLAPLLPPDEAADQFIARIKKLGSEPINDAPKVTVTVPK